MDLKDNEKDVYGVSEKVYEVPSDHAIHTNAHDADAAAKLVAGFTGELDPVEAKRVLGKIDRNMLPMMMILYLVQFMDKTTLGNSVNLGLKTDNHLTSLQYNWLGTIFYLAYLVFEYPQNLALQRFPAGRWMSLNILCWSIFLMCHAACHNFVGLFICRLGLGICEGSITAGFLVTTTMFYTHAESSRRVGFWFLMNGTAQIVSGFLAYGILHSKSSFAPWRIFMLTTGLITLVVAVWFLLRFPNNPMDAKFLSKEEKVIAIERIRSNQSGVENKHWKKDQFIETLLDWKTWAFFLFAALDNVPNSLTNQNSIIIKSLGFTALQTTLLGCVSGVIEIITIYTGTLCVKKYPNARAIIGTIYFIPNIIGSALILGLPFSNKTGQLIALYITGVGTTGFVLSLAWITAVTAGHTKKVTTNAIMLIGYCLGNLCAPQMWKAEYSPKNTIPWIVILVCYTACPIIMLCIAYFLQKENRRRDTLPESEVASQDNYMDEIQTDGTVISKKVDLGFMDLTDRQNLRFRYAL
ncbi:Permease of the major facilitator superfamily [Phaffia rhodozyma]|uniref:Permease of the major facilitator superfamily n=1 Tax=Phaffia rhodozyma TaxID=264483 RepID=A0A0F7SW50_PHARH|nr:Permease of the major facilitator superfamily [Phaffia rhodozyma]